MQNARIVDLIILAGGGDPELLMKAISSHLQLLKDEVDHYCKSKAVVTSEDKLKGVHYQQLD
jgi:hypothetical protein